MFHCGCGCLNNLNGIKNWKIIASKARGETFAKGKTNAVGAENLGFSSMSHNLPNGFPFVSKKLLGFYFTLFFFISFILNCPNLFIINFLSGNFVL